METPIELKNLPQDLKDITITQFKVWVKYFSESKTIKELRKWQDIQRCQIGFAQSQLIGSYFDYHIKNRLNRGISCCQIVDDVCSAAIHLKSFGDGWQAFIPKCLEPVLNEYD